MRAPSICQFRTRFSLAELQGTSQNSIARMLSRLRRTTEPRPLLTSSRATTDLPLPETPTMTTSSGASRPPV